MRILIVALILVPLACTKKSSLNTVPIMGVTPTPAPPTVVADRMAIVVDTNAQLPPCDANNSGKLGYIRGEAKTVLCADSSWVALQAPTSAKFLSQKQPEPAGSNCKYSGEKIESGLDVNGNGILEDAEVGSRFYLCEGGIEKLAKEIFVKYVHSIGVVVSDFGGCKTAGTGWVVAADQVITNDHVVERDAQCSTSSTVRSNLKSIKFYTLKESVTADNILKGGLPHWAGFSPSLDDFNVNDIAEIDVTPSDSIVARADLAFLKFPNSLPPLLLNSAAQDIPMGEELVSIGYSNAEGPKLATGSVFHIRSCEAMLNVFFGSSYTSTDCNTQMKLMPQSQMFSWWGFGDAGGSGGPVFNRFGNVAGIFTWGAGTGDTPYCAAQYVSQLASTITAQRLWRRF